MAAKKDDPTITKGTTTATGDHVAPIGEYKDNPDKPAPDSIAQIEIVKDPLFATGDKPE